MAVLSSGCVAAEGACSLSRSRNVIGATGFLSADGCGTASWSGTLIAGSAATASVG